MTTEKLRKLISETLELSARRNRMVDAVNREALDCQSFLIVNKADNDVQLSDRAQDCLNLCIRWVGKRDEHYIDMSTALACIPALDRELEKAQRKEDTEKES